MLAVTLVAAVLFGGLISQLITLAILFCIFSGLTMTLILSAAESWSELGVLQRFLSFYATLVSVGGLLALLMKIAVKD